MDLTTSRKISVVVGGLQFFGSSLAVAFPNLVSWPRWIGFVGMAIGLFIVVIALFIDVDVEQHFKLEIKLRKPWRVPLLELYGIANEKGWGFLSNGSLTVLDFAAAIRQAGIDRKMMIWGRRMHDVSSITRSEPLLPIPPEHWNDHELDACACVRYSTNGQAIGLITNNSSLRTNSIPLSKNHGCFADIHVHRREALRWLRRDAKDFLGRHEKTNGH